MLCRKGLILTVLSLLLVSMLMATTTPSLSVAVQNMNQMPLAFTKNMGQWDERVLFRASAGSATMWFTREGVTYQFTRRIDTRSGAVSAPGLDSRLRGNDNGSGNDMERDSVEQLVLTAKFIGANPNPEVVAEGQMEYKCNYFLGNDPSKWHTDVPNYEAITLKDIYPGIDLRFSADRTGQAAYEFIVASGADLAQVKVEYEGIEGSPLEADGRAIVRTKWGDAIAAIRSPLAICAPDQESEASWSLSDRTNFSRQSQKTTGLDAEGKSRRSLGVYAVGLAYSTYLGGGGFEQYIDVAVDASGCAYVTGGTSSDDFPTENPFQSHELAEDAFVTKLSISGNTLIYSTYLGGEYHDFGRSIAVGAYNSVYIIGQTSSVNFPTENPYKDYLGAPNDVFVTKLSSSGNSLIYSTYLGGSVDDWPGDIAVHGGNAYLTGCTGSDDFPTRNAYQAVLRGVDAFVTKLSADGSNLVYSTFLGGGAVFYDQGLGIAVDASGCAYVTGVTDSDDFPTENPFQPYEGGKDAFVTKFSSSGSSLVYSTYLGGTSEEWAYYIAVNGNGNAYVIGFTYSPDFPTQNPYQTDNQGGTDAFVTKLSSSGNSLIFSTYLGGGDYEWGSGIAVDGSGNAYVTGFTYSPDFPTQNPFQAWPGDDNYYNAFVTKLSSSGNSLIYSTYLGGEHDDLGLNIAVDASGCAYVAGYINSYNFPTQNPYQMTYQGGFDAFVTKLKYYLCGDANGDGAIDISDPVYLIEYIFGGGPEPNPYLSGDADCSGGVDISDAVYLIAYIFGGGPEPCAGCK